MREYKGECSWRGCLSGVDGCVTDGRRSLDGWTPRFGRRNHVTPAKQKTALSIYTLGSTWKKLNTKEG